MAGRVAPGAFAATFVVVLAFHSGGYFAADWGLIALVFLAVAVTAILVADTITISAARAAVPLSLVALALWQLTSVLWSTGAALPVLDAERSLLYASAAAALLLSLTPTRVESLLPGVALGVTVVAVYALATRLAPGSLGGAYDPSAGYQLAKPIGYGNALGLLLVLGIALAVGVVLGARPSLAIAAGAALVPLTVALYFTFSRGAALALAFALAITVALDTQRWTAAAATVAVLVLPGVGVSLASHSHALTTPGATLATAQAEGRVLAGKLVLLTIAAAGIAGLVRMAATRMPRSERVTRAVAVTVCIAVAAGLVAVVARAGSPSSIAGRVEDRFNARPPPEQDPAGRLLSLRSNGRVDYWRVAARMVERDPLLGDGAGAFAVRWTRERPVAFEARDAHNLYLESAAELGPVGVLLLLTALAAPLTALRHGRQPSIGAAAAGAYGALLLQAAIDWDWEIPLLVLIGIACGVSLLVLARDGSPVNLTTPRRAAGAAVAATMLCGALVAHVGNRATAAAARALSRDDTAGAVANARRAHAWMPWSYRPWQLLGEAQLREGSDRRALVSLRRAASLDPGQWDVWFDLSVAATGRGRARARARAVELNPLGMRRSQTVTVGAVDAVTRG